MEPSQLNPLDEIIQDCSEALQSAETAKSDPDEALEKSEIFGAHLLRSIAYSLQGQLPQAQKDIDAASTALGEIDDLDFQSEYRSIIDKITTSLQEDVKSQRQPAIAASVILTVAETISHPTIKKIVNLYLSDICRQLYVSGDAQAAVEFCERARKNLGSASLDALHDIEAQALDSLGKTDLALMFLREFVQEKEELGKKIDPKTFATLAYLCASANRPAEALKYASLVTSSPANVFVEVANKFLRRADGRTPEAIRNAIDIMEIKLSRNNNLDYHSRRAQVFLAELLIESGQLDRAEEILRDAVPAFNPRSWIPFSKPLITEGYAEALLALSKLIQQRIARGEKIRAIRSYEVALIWFALVLCAVVLFYVITSQRRSEEQIKKLNDVIRKKKQDLETIRTMSSQISTLQEDNGAMIDRRLKDIAVSQPLDVDYIPKKL